MKKDLVSSEFFITFAVKSGSVGVSPASDAGETPALPGELKTNSKTT